MYDFHGRKVFYFENADTSYAYDGSRYTINGYVRDSKEDIMDKLAMRIISTKDWIKAQLLFWGIVESTLNPKHLLRDELAEMLMVGLQARGNQRDPICPRSIFDGMGDAWKEKYSKKPLPLNEARSNRKRTLHNSSTGASSSSSSSDTKRARLVENSISESAALSRTTRSHRVRTRSPSAQIKVELPVPVVSVVRTPGSPTSQCFTPSATTRSSLSQGQVDKVKAFRMKQYFMAPTGSFTITCPEIETRFPALEGRLRMDIKLLETEHGLYEACFNLGLFEGTAALATREESLSVWCYTEQRKQVPHLERDQYDKEMKRLKRASSAAWHAIGIMEEGRYVLPDLETDVSTPPAFFCEYRCNDDRQLFLKPGLVFASAGRITFADLMGLQLAGSIHLPMLSDEPVTFEGFKVEDTALLQNERPWSAFDTSAIRYGADWKTS